ncbi:hypothetical protein FF098_012085 [Parvularcula flava]|uniref:Integral membrane protein n=1 Tax=Aquisalinus luteolus TaxID=1566827 RepID=A0ABX0HN51_9PROT|nr:hypothetical protein [Aquisalinus luteolus]NHK28649.1 hypothetical protein [Aquisalinus luteolus]
MTTKIIIWCRVIEFALAVIVTALFWRFSPGFQGNFEELNFFFLLVYAAGFWLGAYFAGLYIPLLCLPAFLLKIVNLRNAFIMSFANVILSSLWFAIWMYLLYAPPKVWIPYAIMSAVIFLLPPVVYSIQQHKVQEIDDL